jgi:hypothetical protein
MPKFAYKETAPEVYRIISMRLAEKYEIARYEAEKIRHMPNEDAYLIKLLDKLTTERQHEQVVLSEEETQKSRQQDDLERDTL